MASFGDIYRVNTNIQTNDASLALNRINRDISTNSLALSTGLKINRAEDDAAGYTIAIKLRSRTEGLLSAQRNIADAISVLNIMESGFGSITNTLTEMKSLATRGATQTLGTEERRLVGAQITGLGDVLNKTAEETVFQEIELFKGFQGSNTGALELIFQVGERSIDTLTSYIRSVNTGMLFNGTGKNNAEGDHQLGAVADRITVTPLSMITGTNPGRLGIAADADAADFRVFMSSVDEALQNMISRAQDVANARTSLGVREQVVARSIAANEQAKSRIMDTDFAQTYGERVKLQILQTTASAAMAQANVNPAAVLDLMSQQGMSIAGSSSGSEGGVRTGEGSRSGWPPDLQGQPREPIPVSGVDIDWPPDLAYKPEPYGWPPSL
jgi:flagellin